MTKKIYNFSSSVITLNKKANREYFINEEIEGGLVLQGWEVRGLRARQANITGSYILLKNDAAYLFGATITSLNPSSIHMTCDIMRERKLLLHQKEIDFLVGKINREGYTVIPLFLYWKSAWCKIKIGIAKGKKEYDKRLEIKKREWKLEQERIAKHFNR